MNTPQLRKKLHSYIDSAAENKLKAIYIMLEDDIEANSLLTNDQKKELDKRFKEYKQKKGKDYSLAEARSIYRKPKRKSQK